MSSSTEKTSDPDAGGPRRIVFPDATPDSTALLDQGLAQRLEPFGEFTAYDNVPATNDEYAERIRGAQAVIVGFYLADEVLRDAEGIEMLSFTGTAPASFVNTDLVRERNIVMTNTPGYGNNAVSEHALALLLSLMREIPRHDSEVRSGIWKPTRPAPELQEMTVGVIGYGGIGGRMIDLCSALGMKVLCWTGLPCPSRHAPEVVEFVDLDGLLARSDAVSLHIQLVEATQGLIGPEQLALMKPNALLVNTARGGLVDEAALVDRLDKGAIGGAALDVFATEPLAPDHPLTRMRNVILTPHVAYKTGPALFNLIEMSVDNVVNYLAGHPTNVIE